MPDSAEEHVSCRICMDPKDSYVSLFSHNLSMKVMEVADVQVEKDDGLPSSICTECEQDLEKCYEFRLKVQVSDKKLRENIKLTQVDIVECNIKEERYMDDGDSDNLEDKDSGSMDDEHYDDEPDVAPRISEETEEAEPDPLNHVVVVEENERKMEMTEEPSTQDDMVEEPQVQKIEEVALDPLVCMKQEAETEIMDVDSNMPDPFGPSSSVMSSALPDQFPILSSSLVKSLKSDLQQNVNQRPRTSEVMAKQYQVVRRKQSPMAAVSYSHEASAKDHITVEGQNPNQGFMLIPQTGINLNSGILIPCIKVTKKSVGIPKSYAHTLDNTRLFVNPDSSCNSFQGVKTPVTNITFFDTQKDGMNNLTIGAAISPGGSQSGSTVQPTTSNSTQQNVQSELGEKMTQSINNFFCSACNVDCGSSELLDEHESGELFICRVCTTIFTNHQKLKDHFFSHKSFTCLVCRQVFYCKKDLLHHKKTVLACKTPVREKCKFCDNKFVHRENLEIHMEEKHPNAEARVFLCFICNKQFKTYAQLSQHMKSDHSAYENVECEICKKILAGPEKLKIHIKATHLQSSEVCPVCKKVISNKVSLSVHMEKHTGNEVKCEVCGIVVKGKITLREHMRVHLDNALYTCTICNLTFNTRHKKERHTRNFHKSAPKPVICELCGKEYKSMKNLRNHLLTHSDEKPHVCEVCGAAFKAKVTLKTHSRIHSDVLKYKCNHCGEGFRWKQTFDKHVLNCESSNDEEMSIEAESD